MSSPSVADMCAPLSREVEKTVRLLAAQRAEIDALQRKVIALTDELLDVRIEGDQMRSALASLQADQHKGAA